jgi:CheY-like chemotaxis protein/HPt (histidine-containing phosphotransfer) domain-containing protein
LLLLERSGCRADVVSNGLEVLEALHRQVYDVILMDVQMPEMDGLEAARAVRSSTWQDSRQHALFASQPYIIAMTANAMQGDREDCLAAGMDDYISKPVQIEELAHALSRGAKARKPEKCMPQEIMENSIFSTLDKDAFLKFQASLGEENQSMVASLIRDFLAEGEQLAADLHTAALKGNAESIRLAAHSLKSSSQMFGALTLAQTCRLMETNARSGNLERMTQLAEKMDLDLKGVQTALKEWLNLNGD